MIVAATVGVMAVPWRTILVLAGGQRRSPPETVTNVLGDST
jgi:hypothetical protein